MLILTDQELSFFQKIWQAIKTFFTSTWNTINTNLANLLKFDQLLDKWVLWFKNFDEVVKWLLLILLLVIVILGTISLIKKTFKLFIIIAIVLGIIFVLFVK